MYMNPNEYTTDEQMVGTQHQQRFSRIRSVREVARYCKEMDPETQITEYTLRKMIAEGTIPAVKSGTKYLINLDRLLEMLNNVGAVEVAVS